MFGGQSQGCIHGVVGEGRGVRNVHIGTRLPTCLNMRLGSLDLKWEASIFKLSGREGITQILLIRTLKLRKVTKDRPQVTWPVTA